MALKKLLGLESFSISDSEIIKRIRKAQSEHKREVVFTSPQKKVTIRLSDVDPAGMMREYWDYYAK